MPDIYDKILTKVLTEDNRRAPWGMVVGILRAEIAKTHGTKAAVDHALRRAEEAEAVVGRLQARIATLVLEADSANPHRDCIPRERVEALEHVAVVAADLREQLEVVGMVKQADDIANDLRIALKLLEEE
jgi:plasmid stabilization system protein ParE